MLKYSINATFGFRNELKVYWVVCFTNIAAWANFLIISGNLFNAEIPHVSVSLIWQPFIVDLVHINILILTRLSSISGFKQRIVLFTLGHQSELVLARFCPTWQRAELLNVTLPRLKGCFEKCWSTSRLAHSYIHKLLFRVYLCVMFLKVLYWSNWINFNFCFVHFSGTFTKSYVKHYFHHYKCLDQLKQYDFTQKLQQLQMKYWKTWP